MVTEPTSESIKQPSLTIRLLTSEDRPFFASLAKDPRVVKFVGDGQPWTDERIDARVTQAVDCAPVDTMGAARWFVAAEPPTDAGMAGEPHDDRVGLIVAWLTEDGVEVGYWVRPAAWGRGIARAIVAQALPQIVSIFGVGRPFCARVQAANLASVKVLLGCGFERTGSADGYETYALDPREVARFRRGA